MSLYAKIEHNLYENPKIVGLSDAAFRAYLESILYSGKHLTDGFLDERIVARMWGNDVADELSANDPVNPSWTRVEGGWQIYGYCERQTTKADVDAMREQKRNAANARWHGKDNAEAMHGAYDVQSKTDAEAMPDTDTEVDTNTDTKIDNKDRATRLPNDWFPSDDLIAWTKTKTPSLDWQLEFEQFRLYWLNKTGRDSIKKNWDMTWQKWILNAAKWNPELTKQPPVVKEKHRFTGYVD